MRLLLDTHTLLWFALTDPQLSGTVTSLIIDPDNEKLVSPASYWEIAIKISIKKYALSKPYEIFMDEAIDENGVGYLHVEQGLSPSRRQGLETSTPGCMPARMIRSLSAALHFRRSPFELEDVPPVVHHHAPGGGCSLTCSVCHFG